MPKCGKSSEKCGFRLLSEAVDEHEPNKPQAETLAGGKPNGKLANGKRGRRKGVPTSDVELDKRIAKHGRRVMASTHP